MERFELAVKAITRAGAALRASRVEDSDIQFKTGYKDLVTYWDRRIEQLLLTTPGVQYTFLEGHEWRERLVRLARTVRGVRCLGSVALELCELAAGESDLFVTLRSSPWDHNAARIIVVEAGGAICTVSGDPLPITEKSTVLAANSKESLSSALKLLSP